MRSIDDLGGSLSPLNSQCVLMLLHQPKSLEEKSVRGGVFFRHTSAHRLYHKWNPDTRGVVFGLCPQNLEIGE